MYICIYFHSYVKLVVFGNKILLQLFEFSGLFDMYGGVIYLFLLSRKERKETKT